ncbi:Fe-S oxidoreductase, partial [Streptomyces sp. NPDC091281]
MHLAAIVVSLTISAAGLFLFTRATVRICRIVLLGQPVPAGTRTDHPYRRSVTLTREFLGHTRMNRWGIIGFAHWFVAVGFLTLVLALVQAYGQLFRADWTLPVLGTWPVYEVYVELMGLMTVVGILVLIVVRQLANPRRAGRKSRFAGSRTGQAYFVETAILVIGLAILILRGLEGVLHHVDHYQVTYFASYPLVLAFDGLSATTLETLVHTVAAVKISTSLLWMVVVGLNTNMGVAWHRFLAFPNIWFKREASGGTALGGLLPMTSGGKP